MSKTKALMFLAGAIGIVGAAGAMLYADLPEGPTIRPLLIALLAMTTVTGLVTGLTRSKKEARRIIIGLVIGQVIGIVSIVITSLPFSDGVAAAEMLGAVGLAGNLLGSMALLIGLIFGTASIEIGNRLGKKRNDKLWQGGGGEDFENG